jgi:hypothetical protein
MGLDLGPHIQKYPQHISDWMMSVLSVKYGDFTHVYRWRRKHWWQPKQLAEVEFYGPCACLECKHAKEMGWRPMMALLAWTDYPR